MSVVIQTQALSRVYKTYKKTEGFVGSLKGFWKRDHLEKIALKPTTLELHKGEIIGLVGANGAGKTTLLKLLSGLIHPSSGTATVLGHNPWERNFDLLRRISLLLGQKNQLWWDLSAEDSFGLLTEIYDLDPIKTKKRIHDLAAMLNATSVLSIQLRRLSLGERMKMEIMGALLHQPEILFLDEPTIGLDIVAQTNVRDFLQTYVNEFQPTVILTSHYMDDISVLADRLLLMSQGALVYDGTVEDFRDRTPQDQRLTFALSQPLEKDLQLTAGPLLRAGEQNFGLNIPTDRLPVALSQVAALPGIHNLQLEQVDFEDTIHGFLAQESGLFSARDSAKS